MMCLRYWCSAFMLVGLLLTSRTLHASNVTGDWFETWCLPECIGAEGYDESQWAIQVATITYSKSLGLSQPPTPIPGDACSVRVSYRRVACDKGGGVVRVSFAIEDFTILCNLPGGAPDKDLLENLLIRLFNYDDPLNLIIDDTKPQNLALILRTCWRRYQCRQSGIVVRQLMVPCSNVGCCRIWLQYDGEACGGKRFNYPGGATQHPLNPEALCIQDLPTPEPPSLVLLRSACNSLSPSGSVNEVALPCSWYCLESFDVDRLR